MPLGLQVADVLGYQPSDDERSQANLRMLGEERAKTSDPKKLKPLDDEIAKEQAIAAKLPAPSASQGIGDQVTSILMGTPKARSSAPLTAPQTAPQAPAAPVATTAPSSPVQASVTPIDAALGKLRDAGPGPVDDTLHAVASGIGHQILGGLHGLYSAATGGTPEETAAVVRGHTDETYQPTNPTAQNVMGVLGSGWNPLNWIPNAGKKIADVGTDAGLLNPKAAAAIEGISAVAGPGTALKGLRDASLAAKTSGATRVGAVGPQSVGAAAADMKQAAIAQASPELGKVIAGAKNVHPEALKRQVEADSLPIPMKLSAARATGDVNKISEEYNAQGKYPQISKQYDQWGKELHQNIDAIRDSAAPDVYGTDHVQNGQAIIDAYKTTDKAIRTDISAKYKALEDANGGNFPVDGVAFADAAEKALAAKLKTDFVPAPIAKQLERFKNGEPMDFEKFESMRTNLAAEMRKAERSGDGNAEFASSLVREALEQLPMTGETAAIKPIADAARAAAKARFDLLKKDPAYKAAVNDATAADDFINKFVINGKVANVKTMVENLGPGSTAHQTMAAGVINALKNKAGKDFSQANFNKGLQQVSPDGKLLSVVGPEAAKQLQTLGNVAEYTQKLGRGSIANTSHTFIAEAAEHAKKLAEAAANAKTGIPLASMGRRFLQNRREARDIKEMFQTGAGIAIKDVK